MKKLTWLAIVGTALLFMQVHADSVEQEVEKYIRMPPVIRLAAPVVSSDKNGREEWIGISLMGPMPDTDFYGIHCAYFIENNKNSVINGIWRCKALQRTSGRPDAERERYERDADGADRQSGAECQRLAARHCEPVKRHHGTADRNFQLHHESLQRCVSARDCQYD